MELPTERQLDLISEIEEILGIEFEGGTKLDASKFIDENLDDYELMKNHS